MRIQKIALSTALALAVSATMTHAVQFINFSVYAGASMQFNGTNSSFQFLNGGSGNQWWITGESGGATGALLDQGHFLGGPWTYGSIFDNGSGTQTATINASPAATLEIFDGSVYATANVTWGVIDTVSTAGGINESATINLSNLSYSGGNADLASIFDGPSAQLVLSFTPGMTLSQLTSGSGPFTSAFSGSITATPEPGSLLVAGLGFAMLLGRRVFKR
jgi:hypothetical protein